MEKITIKKVNEFFQYLCNLPLKPEHVIFRGVQDCDFGLIPKIGRNVEIDEAKKNEKLLLNFFKQQAPSFLNYDPIKNWEWLTLAQHYYLPTRLLDWTQSPLIAAFFAVEKSDEHSKKDCAIYVYDLEGAKILLNVGEGGGGDPFSNTIDDITILYPKHITPRIRHQMSVFTAHKNLCEEYNSEKIKEIIVKSEICNELKMKLDLMGVNRSSLFPDLENLCRNLTEKIVGSGETYQYLE